MIRALVGAVMDVPDRRAHADCLLAGEGALPTRFPFFQLTCRRLRLSDVCPRLNIQNPLKVSHLLTQRCSQYALKLS